MKLLLIATAWVTGLFMVIAAVTAVALATGPAVSTSGAGAVQTGFGSGRTAGDEEAGGYSRSGDHFQPGQERAGQQRAGQQRAGHGRAGQERAGSGRAGHQRGRRDRTGGSRTHRGAATRAAPAAAGPSAPTRINVVYAHTGSTSTSPFTIGGDGSWELAWSYSCAWPDADDSFTVSEDGTGSVDGTYVMRLGTAGHGVTWAHRDSGTHYLAISTACRWRITVTS